MIITCEACNASFKLDENLLKPTGSKVRCSKCSKVFLAYPPAPPEEAEAAIEIPADIEAEPSTEDLETTEAKEPVPDEFDLSGIDDLFAEENAKVDEGIADEAIEDFDLDFDLESETDTSFEKTALEIEPEEPDELDLSDMETLLDEQELMEDKSVSDADLEDFEMDLDMDPEAETLTGEISPGPEPEEPDELDLSDLEEILDLDEPEEKKPVSDDVDLVLDLETEPELEKIPEGVEPEGLEAVDLSDIEKMLEIEKEEAREKGEQEGFEIESDIGEEASDMALPGDLSAHEITELDEAETIDDRPETVEPVEVEDLAHEFAIEERDDEDFLEDEISGVEPVLEKTAADTKKRISRPVLVLLILALLAGGCYGTYVVLDFMNIKIPFVSDYLKPKPSDALGNLKIDTLDIDSKFVQNVKAGKLFVITGRIKNGYSNNRGYIKITGKLYTKGKTLSKTSTVFCGNVLSDIELSNMDLKAIEKRLANRLGDNKSNMKVKPGEGVQFMIVFSNLPENLEEFAIEVTGSTSV